MLPSGSMVVPSQNCLSVGLLCRVKGRVVDRSEAKEKYRNKIMKEFVSLEVLIFFPHLVDDTQCTRIRIL